MSLHVAASMQEPMTKIWNHRNITGYDWRSTRFAVWWPYPRTRAAI